MEPRALHILVKHSTTELQLFKWNCQKPHITLVPMSEYFKILFQNQNANEVISGSKCMNSFSLLSICLFPWLSKTGLTFRLHFIPGSSEWLPHCSRGRLLLLYYSLWEQSSLWCAENCCLVAGIFTSAWVLLYRAKLKITPQLEVIHLRIWYF